MPYRNISEHGISIMEVFLNFKNRSIGNLHGALKLFINNNIKIQL
mgnify:FL=1|tara:strand:+ start:6810 stop:6944 length:135 start_codon:yes stop_codon:yes gene_type:complete